MRSTLDRTAIWLVLVAYWLNIRAPLAVMYLAMGLIHTTTKWLTETARDLAEDFRTTRKVSKL